mmetsp:Transcript_29221/g.67061  ORF Transcript_29221/g.67061 Transcript_29221/m.67061 type:complete len:624 (-) Transcript_29221:796-2667(-)
MTLDSDSKDTYPTDRKNQQRRLRRQRGHTRDRSSPGSRSRLLHCLVAASALALVSASRRPASTAAAAVDSLARVRSPPAINDMEKRPVRRHSSEAQAPPPRVPLGRRDTLTHLREDAVAVSTRGGEGGKRALSRLRDAVFPIYGGYEMTKFFSLGLIKFFIIFVLTLTRDTKDTLIVTQCGAEAIAFLKVYGVLPSAALFIAYYTKISSLLPKQTLFYVTCVPFFIFFFLFSAVIYPNANKIEPSLDTILGLMRRLPGIAAADAETGALAVVANIFSHWTSSLFYVVSEIYSSVSVGILFWQFANDVVGVSQAKRFYPLFGQMSSLAPIVAGQYVVRYASTAPDFATSLQRLTTVITASGVGICAMYSFSNALVARHEPRDASDGETEGAKKKSKKPKMTLSESARFLASSEYLRLVSTLVIGYGLSINFTEIIWKSLVKRQYPNSLDYQRFMGNFSSIVGVATFLVIFVGGNVIKHLGWRVGALATPTTMAVIALPFFTCIFLGLDTPATLKMAVVMGTVQSLLSKATKYALFDPTTQMSYIPLDEDSKVKGKAAIDVLGSRVGKSGGSLLQQGLVLIFGNIISAAPAVMAIFYAVLFAWINAANRLSVLFAEMTRKSRKDL